MFAKNYQIRDWDDLGCGHFQASRGNRKHNGIDFCAPEGEVLLSPVNGTVTKLGYCYNDDLSYRYVEVTDENRLRHRFFYVSALVAEGEQVAGGRTALGKVQDIAKRYKNQGVMQNHFHYEVKDTQDHFIDPSKVA